MPVSSASAGGEAEDASDPATAPPDRRGRAAAARRRRSRSSVHDASTMPAMPPRIDEQQALGQQLPHQARALRAERQADRDFAPALAGAREQQVGDVGAGDQQHDADDDHQDRRLLDEDVARPGRWDSAAPRAAAPRWRCVPCCRPGTPARDSRRPSCRLARACSAVTPGFSRATLNRNRPRRVSYQLGLHDDVARHRHPGRRAAAEQHAGEVLRRDRRRPCTASG